MITDIALRSHQRTVHQDWSIYLRAARCAESSARANVRSQLRSLVEWRSTMRLQIPRVISQTAKCLGSHGM